MHKRTGLRRPKNYLKVWGDKNWTRRLTPRLSVGRVDEALPCGGGGRKPWYLLLTQDPDLLKTLGPVRGAPKNGTNLLLSEDDVVALVQYLLEPQTAVWMENPEPSEPGEYSARLFLQPGMVGITSSGKIVNGEADWTPKYFKRQQNTDTVATAKIHTLPWKLPPSMIEHK
jgi:hypothetical protein